nr:K(+) efflux antiporter 6 [Ipomoea batatas]
MVSELAGEGAMSPQLPTPASRSLETVELRFRHRKQIRRGVNVTKTIALFSPSFNRSRSVKFLSKVLNNPLFEVVYRSESVKNSSRVLDPPSIAIVSSWSRVLLTHLILSLLVDSQFAVFNPTSWSRSVKRSSAELVNPLFDSVCVQSLSVNPLFIASRSRSVERTSTSLDYQPGVCAVEIAQSVNFIFVCVSRSRRVEQPVLDSDSENGEGSPKDSNTRFLAVFNPSRVLVNAVFAVLDRDSWSRSGENTTAPENGEGSNAKTLDRVFEEEFSENDPPQPKFAVKKHLRSKLPWRVRIHFSPVLCSLFIERFALVTSEALSARVRSKESVIEKKNVQIEKKQQARSQPNVFIISNFKSKYPVLQLDLRLISDLVVVIVAATCGGIAFACAGQTVITGYLLAGSIVRFGGFNVVIEIVQVETVAQFGVMEKNSTNTLHGQVTIGTLILQDCAVGILFALLPELGGTLGVLQGVMSMTRSGVLMVIERFEKEATDVEYLIIVATMAVSERIGKCLLELNGSHAIVIMDDAEIELVARSVLFAAVGISNSDVNVSAAEVKKGNEKVAKFFENDLEKDGAYIDSDVNSRNYCGQTALLQACQFGH